MILSSGHLMRMAGLWKWDNSLGLNKHVFGDARENRDRLLPRLAEKRGTSSPVRMDEGGEEIFSDASSTVGNPDALDDRMHDFDDEVIDVIADGIRLDTSESSINSSLQDIPRGKAIEDEGPVSYI